MSKFSVGDRVVYMAYGLNNAELHTIAETENEFVRAQDMNTFEHEDDFVFYDGSDYQWQQEGKKMYAVAQARIRELEDQLAVAREALEPFATGETNVSYIPFEHFKTAARVWRQLTACDHVWQTTSEAPVVLYQTCSKCGETRRVEKAGGE